MVGFAGGVLMSLIIALAPQSSIPYTILGTAVCYILNSNTSTDTIIGSYVGFITNSLLLLSLYAYKNN